MRCRSLILWKGERTKKIVMLTMIFVISFSEMCVFIPKAVASGSVFSLLWNRSTPQVQGMAIDDINSDGMNEVVYVEHEGRVHAVNYLGSDIWTFDTGWYTNLNIGDLENDGTKEVVVSCADRNVYCINGLTGTQKWKFSTSELASHGNVTLTDVDGDGKLEVITGEWDSSVYSESSAKVYVINSTGAKVWDYTFDGDTLAYAEDVNNDGKSEVVVYWGRPEIRSNGYITMFNSNGSIKWSADIPGCAFGPIFFVDINNDGEKETIACKNSDDTIVIINSTTGSVNNVANVYGRLYGMVDKKLLTYKNNKLYALDSDGDKIWESSVSGAPTTNMPILPVADLDMDGRKEIIVGTSDTVYVISEDGTQEWSTSTAYVREARVGDVNGDGYLDVAVGTDSSLSVFENTYSSSAPTRYPWSMFHHDPRHAGYSESPAPKTNQTRWNFTTSSYVISSPSIMEDRVYVGSRDKRVYCLNATSGTQIWNFTTNDSVDSSPAVANGRVYVGSWDGRVYCLNSTTGAHIWNFTTGGAILESSPAVVEDKVYIGTFTGKVYCINALSGVHIWNYTISSGPLSIRSSPAVANGKVYVGADNGKIYCLNSATGAHIWNYTVYGGARSSVAVAYGKIYVGSDGGIVYCLDATAGIQVWNYTTGDMVTSSPAVVDGKVYVGSWDGNVYCLEAATGAKVWNYTTGDKIELSSPAVADGKVYVGSNDENLYCLNMSTGVKIWNFKTNGVVLSSPAVADGMVFVGSFDFKIYAFGDIIRVPADYSTIQGAIDAATSNATIWVAAGVYNESVVINKTLTIIGKRGSSPIFGGGGSGIAVTLSSNASGSIVAGIVITNWDQGIMINNAYSCKIYDNIISLMTYNGIAIEGSDATGNLVYNNVVQNNQNIAINLTASSTKNTIHSNTVCFNNIGIYVESADNIIYGNTLLQNEVGIEISNSGHSAVYWNNFIGNSVPTVCEASSSSWDHGYSDGGNYWSTHTSVDLYSGPYQNMPGSDGIVDVNYTISPGNVDRYPLVKPFCLHDMQLVSTVLSKNVVGQNFTLTISLKILNHGIYDETFTVNIYAGTSIKFAQYVTMIKRTSSTITFVLNATFAKGNYVLSAYLEPVLDEKDKTDNALTTGSVYVGIPGDVALSYGQVDMKDIGTVVKAFGSVPGHPKWNPNMDINSDGKVDMKDIGITVQHFGETDP